MEKWKATTEIMKELECDIVGMSETCVNWKLKRVKQKYKSILQKQCKSSSMSVSPTQHLYNQKYLPGGTATITIGKYTRKIEAKLQDPSNMGRWSGTTFRVNKLQKLHVITA
jgi:D-alanine-D-alanine ligase-like ATP-grasp enzyme